MSRKGLHNHNKRFHPEMLSSSSKKCDKCEFTFRRMEELIFHCQSVHHEDIKILCSTFKTEDDFKHWKEEVEKSKSVRFIRTSGARNTKGCIVSYYHCNRSGIPCIKSDRKRAVKNQGSCKIGTMCTSFINVKKNVVSGVVNVEYCLDHRSHDIQLAHLKISDGMRNTIATKLSEGVETNKILDDVRDNIANVPRDFLVTRRDINNIKNQFNIPCTRQHAVDSKSLGQQDTPEARDCSNIQRKRAANLGIIYGITTVINNITTVINSSTDNAVMDACFQNLTKSLKILAGTQLITSANSFQVRQSFKSNENFRMQKHFFSRKKTSNKRSNPKLKKSSVTV